MSHLEALKEKLKYKPEVQPNKGVKVVLGQAMTQQPLIQELNVLKQKPLIIVEKDEGKRAQDILERIKQQKLSAVIRKIPETEIKIPKDSVPLRAEQLRKQKTNTKLNSTIKIVEDDEEQVNEEEVPVGGPRLDDLLLEKKKEDDIVKEIRPDEEKVDNVIEKDIINLKMPGEEKIELIEDQNEIIEIKPKKRISKKPKKDVIELGPGKMIEIGDTSIKKRLPPTPIPDIKVSNYYMNNREIFVNFINGLFEPYKEDLLDESKEIKCEDIGKDTGEISLLTHQKIVKDYINLYTPYRGLLLYHGLGSGKTCSSIAIAEGIKTAKKVIIMTPASLRRNYIEEIKKCGDLLYRKNQYWEWISTDTNPKYVSVLSTALGLQPEYIKRQHGAWLVNVTKPTNYKDLSANDKKVLNDQIDEMISNKYTFINYNGLRRDRFKSMTNDFETNIFDNSVVIIDEAHNLISRIVNKINKMSKFSEKKRGIGASLPQSLALLLYEFLLNATDCRVVLLTGTPIINYPNEIGILFNILRGYIKTWSFTLNAESKKISLDILKEIFAKEKFLDYINYVPSSKKLTITRNPYGFESKITGSGYKGVTNEKKEKRNDLGEIEKDANGNIIYNERGQISDIDFIQRIVKILKNNDITAVANGTNYEVNTALPDTLDEFINIFIDKETSNVSNIDKFKRRIMGLTSYFRSAQEELLPAYDKNFDKHEVLIPMSDYQFKIYEDYRHEERQTEKEPNKKGKQMDENGLFKEPSSTYRIFSRLACNFVMPSPPGRPNPTEYQALRGNKDSSLLVWIKDKYFKESEIDPEFKEKYIEFIESVPKEILNEESTQILLKQVIDQYLKEYLENNYRKPIKSFFIEQGYSWDKGVGEKVINLDVNKKEEILELKNASKKLKKVDDKAAKEQKKAEEKAVKEQKKAEEKAAKERQKAEEKAAKERQKAEEKEAARLARIKEKEDARAMIRSDKKQKKDDKVKIAIIVPFRDSEENKPRTAQLNEFVRYMETYLSGYDYKIFVVEQSEDGRKFNRGELLNIGFRLAELEDFNNFIFHDVDLLPSDSLKQYYTKIPTTNPIHIAAVWDRYGSNPNYFGGIVAFNKTMFEKINGYPNNFWGWGGEDDELYNRTNKFYKILKVKEGSIRDLENLNLKEKLDYLKENDLKFMQKHEALQKHEKTWDINGLKQVRMNIIKKSSCGSKCELIEVYLEGTPELDMSGGGDDDDYEYDYSGGTKKIKAVDIIDEVKDNNEEIVDIVDERNEDELEGDEILEKMGNVEYKDAIKSSMRYLQIHSREYLSLEGLKTYSPKFLAMIENIQDEQHQGLHLVYSQFRSMEGIGIFCLALDANGFAKFKIKRTGVNSWELNMSEEDMGKPCYALYTGTEDAEEREILRNIYNGTWDYIPNNIAQQLRAKSSNNNLGEIIKVLMITSAGSEGINLRNTRYVHIMEPYWHPVRVEQVIGRARRICSHQSLPKELQTVEVFIYIMTFTKKQLDSDYAIELKLKDLSKLAPFIAQTSDQKLYEISTIKEQLTTQLLKAVKETSIDCATHIKSSTKEGLVCLSFGRPSSGEFSYNPNYTQDENDTVAALNIEKIDWEARPFTIKSTGKRYMLRMDTRQVYDYDSVIQAKEVQGVRPILLGKLVKNKNGEYEIVKEKI